MLAETNPGGATLKYEFVETLRQINPMYILRSIGGTFYLVGFLLCAFNIFMTARSGKATDDTVEVALILIAKAVSLFKKDSRSWSQYFDRLLENYLPFTVLIFFAVAIGGVVQIIPSLLVSRPRGRRSRRRLGNHARRRQARQPLALQNGGCSPPPRIRIDRVVLRRRRVMKMRAGLMGITGLIMAACGPAELPESSREGRREAGGNADLRLPSQWGSKPAERSRWWDGPETRYPNSGYYSSEGR